MALLTQQALRRYEQSNLYGLIHNFQRQANDDHLIVYRHPIEEGADQQDMRSKNPEKNLRRQRQQQEQERYNSSNEQRVNNDLGLFLGEDPRQLQRPQGGNDYNGGYNGGYAPNTNNQLPSSQEYQTPQNQQINPEPDYQIENDNNSLNSPQMEQNSGGTYFDLNRPNYYGNLNNNSNGYYQPDVPKELPNVTATEQPNRVQVGQGQEQMPETRQLPQPTDSPQQTQPPQAPQTKPTQPDNEPEQTTEQATEQTTEQAPSITYTDANGNEIEKDQIPVDMPNTTEDETSNDEEEQAKDAEISQKKSRVFQEIQGAMNTRKWIESIQQIQLAKKANFDNLPVDHINLIGISNGVSDNTPYRLDLDPMFFKLFKIILIGQNLDITLLARDGNSTEINIAPPDWVKDDSNKDALIDGNYLYSYTDDLDFDKLLETFYRFTYRPVQTKGYTELFITDLPIYPVINKNDDN